jgi:hypothetical protein
VLQEQIGKNKNLVYELWKGASSACYIIDREFDFSYYDIHTALLYIFLNDSHAILILEGYIL